jgi:hypothetical protein
VTRVRRGRPTAPARLALGLVTHAARGRGSKGPRAGRVAEGLAGGPPAWAPRGRAAGHQARRRGDGRHAGATVERVHGLAPHAAAECATARDGVSPVEGRGLVGRGGGADRACERREPCSRRGDTRAVAPQGLVPRRLATARRHPRAVGCRGHLLAALGPVILAVGRLARRPAVGAVAPPGGPAPAQGTGGTPLGGIASGLRAPAAAAPGGPRGRIDGVGCGRATVDGWPVEGMSPHAGKALVRPQLGEPRPGAAACTGHDPPRTRRGNGREARVRSGVQVAGPPECTVVPHDADRPRAGLPVDPAGTWGRRGREAPEVSSSGVRERCSQRQPPTVGCGGGGLNPYQSVGGRRSLRSRGSTTALI